MLYINRAHPTPTANLIETTRSLAYRSQSILDAFANKDQPGRGKKGHRGGRHNQKQQGEQGEQQQQQQQQAAEQANEQEQKPEQANEQEQQTAPVAQEA